MLVQVVLCIVVVEYREGPLVNVISVPKQLGSEPHSLVIEMKTVSFLPCDHCVVTSSDKTFY